MTIETTQFSYIEEALNRVFPDNSQARAEYEALLKAAATPAPLWRPIEECPKVDGKKYLLYFEETGADVAIVDGYYHAFRNHGEIFHGKIITHFAEIPPLPESEAKP